MPKKKEFYRSVSAADNPLRVPGAGLLSLQTLAGRTNQVHPTGAGAHSDALKSE